MTTGIDIAGLNLPLYIILPLLFAYLIWSKFVKKGELKPKKVNDLLDILSLFVFIFVSLMSFTVTLLFIIASLWKEPIPQLLKISTYFVIGFSSLGIIFFVNQYRNKRNLTKRHLQEMILGLLQGSTLFLACFIGLLFVILFTALRVSFGYMIYFLPYIIFLILICYLVISGFLGKTWKVVLKEVFDRPFLTRVLPSLIIVVFIFFLFLVPVITHEDVKKLEYHIYGNPSHEKGHVYLRVQGIINIWTFGVFSNGFPIHIASLPIHYGRYDIHTGGLSGKNFMLWLNISDENALRQLVGSFEAVRNFKEKVSKKYNFKDMELDETKDLINLKFDIKNIKKENIEKLIIDGYIPKNMTELDYVYYDNSDRNDVCYGTGCTLVFNISSDLELPIIFKDRESILNVVNRGIDRQSTCKFIGAPTSNFPIGKEGKVRVDDKCSWNNCDVSIIDTDLEEYYEIFAMGLYLDDNTVIKMNKLKINDPIDIEISFQISCSAPLSE